MSERLVRGSVREEERRGEEAEVLKERGSLRSATEVLKEVGGDSLKRIMGQKSMGTGIK